jgi:D-arabinose 5-phosphate isomerase GutQ
VSAVAAVARLAVVEVARHVADAIATGITVGVLDVERDPEAVVAACEATVVVSGCGRSRVLAHRSAIGVAAVGCGGTLSRKLRHVTGNFAPVLIALSGSAGILGAISQCR